MNKMKFTDAQQAKAIYGFKDIKENFVGSKLLYV